MLAGRATAADVSLDFLRNSAFDNPVYNAPAPKEVNLFSKKDKKQTKKQNQPDVQHFDYSTDADTVNLTDTDYVKSMKEDSKKRKKQFTINVTKNTVLSDEQNSLTVPEAEVSEEYTPEPVNKKLKKRKKSQAKAVQSEKSGIILSSDKTDYFPEKNEIVSTGNAKLEMTGENMILFADKIIFNHDTNSARCYNNVKIIKKDDVTTGDFVNVDLNTAESWIQKPISSNYSVRIKAEEAYVYPDKIEEYDGVANITEDRRFLVGSSSFTNILSSLPTNLGESYLTKPEPKSFKFKAKSIDVESSGGHNIVTMKKIGVYYKNVKLGVLPHLRLVSDKEQTVMQSNIPEIGSDSNLGMYAGPALVLDLPVSSVLKIAPLIVYSNDESKLGFGANATFQNSSNYTQMAYGSPEDKFMLRGFQSITPKLKLNYSQNMYTSQWFLGYRRPMYSIDLEYVDSYFIKDLGMNFEHRLSGGYYSDSASIRKNAEGRLRWMTQLQKNLFTYTNCANTFSLDIGVIGQSSVSQYTTGDTMGVVRVGPSLTTTYRGWSQNVIYFQSGASGKTPFVFDDYYYGRSNLQILETLRINRYLSVGYLASMALGGRESYAAGRYNPMAGDFLQENMFLVSLGPDEAKVTLSYDAVRKATAVYFSMLLGTKDMDIAFKKATIYEPDKLSGENDGFPFIKNTFNKIRYKIFPATDPSFNREKDLYPEENGIQNLPIDDENYDGSDDYDDTIDESTQRELQNKFKQFFQNDLMKDSRM